MRTEIRGRGDPIQLDYRLEKTPGEGGGWKIYNLNVLGVWLVETYRSQFAQEINAKGIDGLIASAGRAQQAERQEARAERPMLVLPPELTHDEAPACVPHAGAGAARRRRARPPWSMPARWRSSIRRRSPCCWNAAARPLALGKALR